MYIKIHSLNKINILILAILDARFLAQSRKAVVIAVHMVKVLIDSSQQGLFNTGCFLLKERSTQSYALKNVFAYKFP